MGSNTPQYPQNYYPTQPAAPYSYGTTHYGGYPPNLYPPPPPKRRNWRLILLLSALVVLVVLLGGGFIWALTRSTGAAPQAKTTPTTVPQPTIVSTQAPGTTPQPSGNCPNAQATRGPDHPADGTDWIIPSLNGGAMIVNFYFPNVQKYSGNNKVLVPEGTNSITFHGGGGSYWRYQKGCATNAQQDFNAVDKYAAVNLQDLINQGLVTVS